MSDEDVVDESGASAERRTARNSSRRNQRNENDRGDLPADSAGSEPAEHDNDRERRAVDAATSERIDDGVLRDAHGEIVPDPYTEDGEIDVSTDDVIERHRRYADVFDGGDGDANHKVRDPDSGRDPDDDPGASR